MMVVTTPYLPDHRITETRGVLFERARYRFDRADHSAGLLRSAAGSRAAAPEAPFQPTDELFVDPNTRRRVRVYLDPGTGERRYHTES